MKKAITRNTLLITALSLLVMFVASILLIDSTNKARAESNIIQLTKIYVQNIETSNIEQAVKLPESMQKSTRITILSKDGTAIYDNMEDITILENHSNRAEFQNAIAKNPDVKYRYSDTLGKKMLYYAEMCVAQNGSLVVVRLSIPISNITAPITTAVLGMLTILAIVIFSAFMFSKSIANTVISDIENIGTQLSKIHQRGYSKLKGSKYKEIDRVITAVNEVSETLSGTLITLESEKNKLYFVLDSMQEGIVAVNDKDEIVLLNRYACEVLDVNENIYSKNVNYLTDSEIILQNFHYGAEKKAFKTELSGRTHMVKISPLSDKSLYIMFLTDITEEEKISKIKSTFFDSASHELKTPITSIKGFTELLENNSSLNEEGKKYLAIMHKDTERLLAIIEDMLYLSKLENSISPINPQKVYLRPIAREAVSRFTAQAKLKGVKIVVKGEGEVVCDADELAELLGNLIDNAIKYNKENGRVDIIMYGKTLTVKDTGIGMENQHMGRIFERFYRVEKGRSRASGGTGLGLAIVKHIAIKNNAQISAHSILGQGTEFVIKFDK